MEAVLVLIVAAFVLVFWKEILGLFLLFLLLSTLIVSCGALDGGAKHGAVVKQFAATTAQPQDRLGGTASTLVVRRAARSGRASLAPAAQASAADRTGSAGAPAHPDRRF